MESPVKQPVFSIEVNKENIERDEVAVPVKGIPLDYEPEEEAQPTVAPGLKEEEAQEPILQENPNRFVLFPIKYHEVSSCRHIFDASRHHLMTRSTLAHLIKHILICHTDLADVQEG